MKVRLETHVNVSAKPVMEGHIQQRSINSMVNGVSLLATATVTKLRKIVLATIGELS
jgi:hypothetical protein